jgi:hypothetical protein
VFDFKIRFTFKAQVSKPKTWSLKRFKFARSLKISLFEFQSCFIFKTFQLTSMVFNFQISGFQKDSNVTSNFQNLFLVYFKFEYLNQIPNLHIWKIPQKSIVDLILTYFWIQIKFYFEILKSFDMNPSSLNQKFENNFWLFSAARSDFGPSLFRPDLLFFLFFPPA